MPAAKQVIALLAGHLDGNNEQVRTIALQIAAAEARQGHTKSAATMKKLLDRAPAMAEPAAATTASTPTALLARPRGDLEGLLTVACPQARLDGMTLTPQVRERLDRMVRQQASRGRLREHGLKPSSKLLLVGPPGSGKTLTASALAAELKVQLFTIRLDAVITRFLGESATKLRTVFDQIAQMRGVYLFDEFDAIGVKRSAGNDVGEVRRILNSFLQFLEEPNATDSMVVAATNHPELLDRALIRRFDEIIEYGLPDKEAVYDLIRRRLGQQAARALDWNRVVEAARGLSQGEVSRAVEEALREAILNNKRTVDAIALASALDARRAMREAMADLFNE